MLRLPLIVRFRQWRRLRRMRKALLALSPMHREAFRMIRIESLSVAQTAERLGIDKAEAERLLYEVVLALIGVTGR
jgi:DNA-directed RNA polymerase specialized sigma24 family protein